MSVGSRLGVARLLLAPLAALAGIALAEVSFAADDCGSGPLRNLGFEQSFSCWASGGADEAAVVGSEGPAAFPVYADKGITVTPYRETKMARLGRPKRLAESQPSGVTSASQTFVADATEIRFAMRIFSFEHRGDDRVVLSLDPVAPLLPASFPVSGATVPMPGGGSASCTQTPCSLTIDVGRRGDFLDSGWREISISGLTVGNTYRLGYKLDSIANSGHPTWAYFDGETNKPPVACFDFNPGSKPGTTSFEGDAFAFSASCSSDPDGDTLSYRWTVSGSTITTSSSTGPIFLAQFPTEDASAQVCLEVSDGRLTSTQCTGLATAPLAVANASPLVTCPGIQALAGSSIDLRCRYADAGWQDSHTVQLGVGSPGAPQQHYKENLPALSTGLVIRTVTAPTTTGTGTATVTDNSAASTSFSFPVVVLTQAELDALEPSAGNDTISTATGFETGWTRQARLGAPTDIDVYRVLKGGNPLPVGSQLGITLKAGADYDVVVLAKSANATTTPFANGTFPDAPLQDSGFQHFGFQHFGFQHFGFQHFGFQHFGFQHFGFQHFGFQHFPFQPDPLTTSAFASLQIQNIPLNAFAAAPAGSGLGSTDVSLGELGTLILGASEGEPAVLKAFSANPSSTEDRILFEVAPGETDHYVFVVAHARAYSPQPYALTMESSTPQPLTEAIGTTSCVHPPLVAGADATTTVRDVYRPTSGPARAVCVGSEERRRATHGIFDENGDGNDDFVSAMTPFFEATQCVYVSLPSVAFDAADQNTCDAELQDRVARNLADIVHQELAKPSNASVENVILLGSYNIVPPCAPPDLAEIGNESFYTLDLLQRSGAKLTTLLASGRNPTDACYADLTPQLNNGHPLYREDLPIGRMVETPAQIVAKARQAVASNFRIPVATALTTGYDFFTDVAQEIDAELAAQAPAVDRRTLISDTWAADELRCEWLGQPTNACSVPRRPGLTSLEAHMTSYGLLPSQEFNFPSATEDFSFVGSPESKGNLPGATFSIGCHSALSVPNEDSIPSQFLAYPVDQDWSENGFWVGPITYGIGHTDTSELGHEGLMLELTRELAGAIGGGPEISVGQALVAAKARFASRQFPTVDPYAEKALVSTALLGVPQMKLVPGPATAAALQAQSQSLAAPAAVTSTTTLSPLTLTMIRNGSSTATSHTSELATFPDGTTAHRNDGVSCGTFARPQLGCVTPALLRAPDPLPVRTVLLRGGSYTDLTNVAIANANVVTEWTEPGSQPRPKTCLEANYPGEIATPNQMEDGRLTIVVNGAQFRCELPESQRGVIDPVGTLRHYTALTFEELTPTSAAFAGDDLPANVLRLDLIGDAATGTVTAKLCATDASGMREVTVLRYLNGQITEFRLASPPACTETTPWEIVVPDGVGAFLRVNFCSNDGLCRVKANKSLLLQALPTKILNTSVNGLGQTTTLTVSIEGFAGVGAEAVIAVEWGDGSATQYVPLFNPDGTPSSALVIDANGDATVKIDHVFAGSGPFDVSVELLASNATGFDETTLSACGDVAGDTNVTSADWLSCSLSNAGTKLDFLLGTLGPIDDANVQYRVRFPASGAMAKLNKGKCTAFSGAACKVTTTGSQVRFQLNAASIWGGTTPLEVFFETQSGVPGSPSEGKPDLMPDSGTYTILP